MELEHCHLVKKRKEEKQKDETSHLPCVYLTFCPQLYHSDLISVVRVLWEWAGSYMPGKNVWGEDKGEVNVWGASYAQVCPFGVRGK